jgi:hypothetical protein
MLLFMTCLVYGAYSWFRVLKNRELGYSWWEPIGFSSEGLTADGRRYLKRFYASMALAVGVVLLALLLYPAP